MVSPDPTWSAAAVEGWQALLTAPADAVVALDFDGTLAPIVDEPTQSRPVDGALEVLDLLAAQIGTVAIVTGRAVRTVLELGGLGGVEALVVLGHYGLERWAGGELTAPDVHPGVQAVREALPDLLADAPDGVAVEDKEHSLVVHTRRAFSPGQALADITPRLQALADDQGLELVPGRMVVELRPPGIDKGRAVAELAEGAGSLLVAGDDLGDLPAFAEVARGRCAGRPGLALGSGGGPGQTAPDEVAAVVDLLLPGPDEVVSLLASLVHAIDRGPQPY